jgi:hypothetical protein
MFRPEPRAFLTLVNGQIFVVGTIVASRASNMTLLIISQWSGLPFPTCRRAD